MRYAGLVFFSDSKDRGWDIGILVLLLIVVLLRLRLLDIPLERDEGEYAYMGRLISEGVVPYARAYSMKLPGTAMMYALLMTVFGESVTGIHLGLAFLNFFSSLLLFVSVRRYFGSIVGFVAASCYALMSLSPTVLGFAAHATQFAVFFVALMLWCMSKYMPSTKAIWLLGAGVFAGMAFITKQQAVFFAFFGLIVLANECYGRRISVSSLVLYLAGVSAPFLTIALTVYFSGSWDKFSFWVFTYARQYAGSVSLGRGLELFGEAFIPMFREYFLIWMLAILGLFLFPWLKLSPNKRLIAGAFTVASFLSIVPGLYFRSHYFVTILPAVGLLAGLALEHLIARKKLIAGGRSVVLTVVLISLVLAVARNAAYYLEDDSETISKEMYGTNPFVEAKEIADYLKKNTGITDKIAVVGSEPEIYFYANRHAATGYLYTYGLMELQPYNKHMQAEMMNEIKLARPQYLVLVKVGLSWLAQPQSPTDIFTWFFAYTKEHYDLVGAGDIIDGSTTKFVWGGTAFSFVPNAEDFILIFKRRA